MSYVSCLFDQVLELDALVGTAPGVNGSCARSIWEELAVCMYCMYVHMCMFWQ